MALSQPDLPCPETAASSFMNMSPKSTISSVIGLAILPVKVKSPGIPAVVETYAFHDNGSNTSFCTEPLLNRLGLEGRQSQGPDLTHSLVGVLSRFRQERLALMSDIEAMFHQVRVRPCDIYVLFGSQMAISILAPKSSK